MKNNALGLASILVLAMIVIAACSAKPAETNTNVAVVTNTNQTIDTSGTPTAGGGESPASKAEALVTDLYKTHDGKKSPFFQTKDRALVDSYFTKALGDLIWKDATSSKGEVGAIDGDPLYNAQDTEIKNFAVGTAEVKGTTATVPVTFTNFGDKKTITFALKQEKSGWRIDNILYGDGDSLLKWLKDTYPANTDTADGEFEGKYQIGDTSCTVKPVKMAYEVRWAKGTGSEMFFFKDGTTFESDGDKANRFTFDDENYNTGTFYRADGKTFPIKRAK